MGAAAEAVAAEAAADATDVMPLNRRRSGTVLAPVLRLRRILSPRTPRAPETEPAGARRSGSRRYQSEQGAP